MTRLWNFLTASFAGEAEGKQSKGLLLRLEPDEFVAWARLALAAARRVAAERTGSAKAKNKT
jgi:hypothetical protein